MKKLFLLFFSLCTLALSAQTDCDHCLDEPIDPVCAQDSSGTVITVPNACIAECIGFEVVDCDEVDIDLPEDCDCELDPADEVVCVEDPSTGDQLFFPNLCVAECFGYTENDVAECEEGGSGETTEIEDCIIECIGNGEGPELVCAIDSTGEEFVVPVCVAECLGLVVIECGDNPGGSDCDCPYDPADEPVCVVDPEYGDMISFSNLCFAECAGFTAEDIVECDFDWGVDSTLIECILECEASTETDSIVCVVDSFGLQIPMSLCVAECLGYEVVSCDLGDNPWGSECDCDIDPDEEWICILTDAETGIICTFPNLCFAECEGYTADDVVDCTEFPSDDEPWIDIDTMMFMCLVECVDSTDWDAEDVVCVQITEDEILAVPNACIAECLGLTIVDCEEGIREDVPVMQILDGESLEQHSALTSYPNPATDRVVIVLDTDYDSEARVQVRSLSGHISQTFDTDLSSGKNTLSFDLTGLTSGHYSVLIITDQEVIEHRIVKQ